ncbi:hypothetical protein VL20_6089 [Microcystis panniformis FACHB-1757]|uniref:Uncharacterized protein n=1 Tax=Microcystis panniformis FACHB-1757 TaxID=1638788 RepID=A0A0K1S9R3_9CHRO|nr:hypothetical protein VL20_6089 [Microcystis panniformis FACHB-1757]
MVTILCQFPYQLFHLPSPTIQLNQRDSDMARGNRGVDELKSWSIMGKMFVYRTFFPHD